jgi:hypothetical protein
MNKNDKIVSNFKEELLFALSLELKKELIDDDICQLEYELENINNVFDDLNENEDITGLSDYIETAEKLISKYDNKKLTKHQFYLTNAQISYLDDVSDYMNLKGKGQRGHVIRTILNELMEDQ